MRPMQAGDIAASMTSDTAALADLKRKAQHSPREALAAAATQFEALFVQNLLKSMREALPQDGPLASDSMKAYTGMFDAQLAQEIARRGLGLGKMLERQLSGTLGDASAISKSSATDKALPSPGKSVIGAPASTGAAGPHAARRGATVTHGGDSSDVLTQGLAALPRSIRGFIDALRPHAEAAAQKIGVPANVLLAQAGLETGWGKHQPRTADGSASHNLFGVKAGKGWNGAVAVAATTEYVAGALTRTVDKFRAYSSYTDAFVDFGKLLTGNARYASAVANAADGAAYAKSLQKGGYATDPQYAAKLTRAIALVASPKGNAAASIMTAAPASQSQAFTTVGYGQPAASPGYLPQQMQIVDVAQVLAGASWNPAAAPARRLLRPQMPSRKRSPARLRACR